MNKPSAEERKILEAFKKGKLSRAADEPAIQARHQSHAEAALNYPHPGNT